MTSNPRSTALSTYACPVTPSQSTSPSLIFLCLLLSCSHICSWHTLAIWSLFCPSVGRRLTVHARLVSLASLPHVLRFISMPCRLLPAAVASPRLLLPCAFQSFVCRALHSPTSYGVPLPARRRLYPSSLHSTHNEDHDLDTKDDKSLSLTCCASSIINLESGRFAYCFYIDCNGML